MKLLTIYDGKLRGAVPVSQEQAESSKTSENGTIIYFLLWIN